MSTTRSQQLRLAATKKKLSSAAPTRKVGQEMTKKKPSAKPAPKPKTPEPESEDEVASSVEEEEEAQEEEDDQMVEEAAPVFSKSKGKNRPATSRPGKKSQEDRSHSVAPDMALLSLFTEYNSVPPPSSTLTEVYPSFIRLIEMNEAVGSIFAPLRAIEKDKREYNSVYSRLAICLCACYRILTAREFANSLSDGERKLLKALRSYSFDDQLIPAPYAPFIKTFGYCDPGNEQFAPIVPAFPAENTLLGNPLGGTHPSTFPCIPALIYAASIISGKNGHSLGSTANNTAGTPVPRFKYQRGDKFCLWRDDNVAFAANAYTYMGIDLAAAASRYQQALHLYSNVAFMEEFPEDLERLEKVKRGSGKEKIPIPEATTGTTGVRSLLEYFCVHQNTRWIAEVMDALTYEAKFFEGSYTLGSFGTGTGPEIMTIAKVTLEAGAFTAPTTWGTFSLNFASKGINLTTRMNLSDADMKVAALTCPILAFDAKPNHPYNSHHGVKDHGTRTDVYPYNNTKVKRIIYDLESKSHLYRTHVRAKMMKEIKDVIGV